jgi:hypothetical protein
MHSLISSIGRIQFALLAAAALALLFLSSPALADVLFGSSFTVHSTNVAYTDINLLTPSSTVSGNLLLANISVKGGSEAVVDQVPYGWTLIRRTDNDAQVSLITVRHQSF